VKSVLERLESDVGQCKALIANSHALVHAKPLLPQRDREQIVCGAFLNLHVAWESFLEDSLLLFLSGGSTISGKQPVSYVQAPDRKTAAAIVIGTQRYFDYANSEFVMKLVGTYFKDGYPYQPHLDSIADQLASMRAIRNAAAHITSSTQVKLDATAQKLLVTPHPGISVYTLVTSTRPKAAKTVFEEFSDTVVAAATLIANG
jgi:hypothetical protein